MFFFFFYWYGGPTDLHVLTHSFPTRRSSELAREGVDALGNRRHVGGAARRGRGSHPGLLLTGPSGDAALARAVGEEQSVGRHHVVNPDHAALVEIGRAHV